MPQIDFPNSPINGQTTTDGRYYFDSTVGTSGAWRSTPLPVGGLPAGINGFLYRPATSGIFGISAEL